MMYWTRAAVVTLSAFTVALLATSLLVAVVVPWLDRRHAAAAPASRATTYFRLRILPLLLAAGFACLLVFPSFLSYEPRQTDEPLTLTLAMAAAAAALLLGAGASRLLRAWLATRAIDRAWRAGARPLHDLGTPVPAFAIDDVFPTVAVVGCRRPVLYIAERVLRECSPGEVDVMIAHECAHIRAADNLKRLVLRACPAVPLSRAIDRAWAAAAEEAADARAAACDATRRMDLAQALVRLARLAPRALDAPVSAFYAGGSIESRVRRLVNPADAQVQGRSHGCLLVAALSSAFAIAFLLLGPAIHQSMETIVRLLP